MKNRRYADLRERTLQKYIHFNRFIRSVYIYLEDRKILQLAMYHAAHQVKLYDNLGYEKGLFGLAAFRILIKP